MSCEVRQPSMRLLGPAFLGSFSWLVLARRCWLRFWGGFARLGLSGVAGCASRLAARSHGSLGVAGGACLRRLRLRLPASLPCIPRPFWRQLRISGGSRSSGRSGTCPRFRRGSLAEFDHYLSITLLLRRPALASGAGSPTGSGLFLSILLLLRWPALASGAGLYRVPSFS